jgi:hypothetical protein
VQLYRYFASQSSEFCCHNPLCCFSMSVYCCKRIFRYRLSTETFGYTLIYKLQWMEFFLFATPSRPSLNHTQTPIIWVNGTISPSVRWLRYVAEHSLPSRAKVKNVWSCTSTPQYVFMSWCLIKLLCMNCMIWICRRKVACILVSSLITTWRLVWLWGL